MAGLPEPPSGTTASPPKKKGLSKTVWVLLGLTAAILIGASFLPGSDDSTTTDTETDSGISQGLGAQDASADVEFHKGPKGFNDCSASYGVLTCTLDITNHSDGTSDYYIEATIYDADGANIGFGNTIVQRVAGGGTAHAELTGTFTGKWNTVSITQVQRTAST